MNSTLRNVLAVLAGIVIGSIINMALVIIGPALIPPPEGVDMTSTESFAASVDLLGPQHFLFPFLAHALGTLVGAIATYTIAANRKLPLTYVIAILFLIGGITAATMIPAPTWFIALDLIGAYLPMAWLATLLGARIVESKTNA